MCLQWLQCIDIENDGNLIINEQELAELFNEYYINIVEKSSSEKLLLLGNSSDASQDEMTVSLFPYIAIILAFEKSKIYVSLKICLICHTYAITNDNNKIIKLLNVKKAKERDGSSAKFVKMSANIIDCHLGNIVNNDISLKKYC